MTPTDLHDANADIIHSIFIAMEKYDQNIKEEVADIIDEKFKELRRQLRQERLTEEDAHT